MDAWLKAALDYLPQWLEFQMRQSEQPGCAMAVTHKGRIVLETAFGHANLEKRTRLTPRHRFRAASHSKSFTAAGIMKLREQGKLGLDDAVGRYIDGLHPDVASATINQILSHSAGLVRDGADSGQFQDSRPFLNEKELRAELAEAPVIDASTRFKYSNHGFGLAGLLIEAVTGETYADWIRRTIVRPSGLKETEPDWPPAKGAPTVSGHTGKLVLGRRLIVPGDNSTHAMAAATGFVTTAGDLARFFASLDPAAARSVLTPASRHEMTRRQWRNAHSALEQYYGLGLMHGQAGNWAWFGHGGGFQSCISRTVVVPGQDLAISILTNAVDGWANMWSDGALHILRNFHERGAATAKTRPWRGRWWNMWGTLDLLPMRDHVVVAAPGFLNPFMDASEIAVTSKDVGTIRLANAFASHGEAARLVRGRNGKLREVRLGGGTMVTEARLVAQLKRRYAR